MGIVNLIKGKWDGKVGQLVGSKWKDKATLRSYAIPSNPNTQGQQTTRKGFGDVSKFVALFSDQIKALSALNTRSMTVRNAILSLNKDMVATGTLDPANLKISRGGLPAVNTFAGTASVGENKFTANWAGVTGSTITAKAVVVVVVVDKTANAAYVGSALNTAGTLEIQGTFNAANALECYAYLLDFRGSAKVGSVSVHKQVTPA